MRRKQMFKWRYVTLDATGTLIRPRQSIGKTYLEYWMATTQETLTPVLFESVENTINERFPQVFRRLSNEKPNFGYFPAVTTAYPWWRELILNALPQDVLGSIPERVGVQLTQELYAHFATSSAWTVFSDVLPVLEHLRSNGVALGVISNFDERLPSILRELGLVEYFQVITTSWGQPHMKPHPSIFQTTFSRLQGGDSSSSSYVDVLHIGDHVEKDYKGAHGVGAHSRWLCRGTLPPWNGGALPRENIITTLADLVTREQ